MKKHLNITILELCTVGPSAAYESAVSSCFLSISFIALKRQRVLEGFPSLCLKCVQPSASKYRPGAVKTHTGTAH